ncbi:MAG TPA: PASTA domain-containing protein [Solirubrobacterales bacterium]|nr:PASTA domain-containing protein [Solirubrobacterales bacterium]
MNRNRRRRTRICSTIAGVALGMLWLAAPAFGQCSNIHGDPAPGYSGPLMRGIYCSAGQTPDQGREESWVVPAGVTSAGFMVSGGDDLAGGRGSRVEATLAVTPGETLSLLLGGGGNASSVRRGDTALLAAGGGNGVEPDYVAPGATAVAVTPRGAPNPPYPGNGSLFISWYSGWYTSEEEQKPVVDPPPQSCVVPKLRGRRPVEARKALRAASCASGDVVRSAARPGLRGRVIGQSQPPGTVLPHRTDVDFTVGRR